jgi:hypothetical protein
MATVRVNDALLRKNAGGQRVTFKPSTAPNAAERALESERKEQRKRFGPSVRRAMEKTLTTRTPLDVLVDALLANTCRSLVLDASLDDEVSFIDTRAAVIASAIRNNRSVLAVTLRALPITEVGVCSILESLKRNPTVRAVSIEQIGLTPKSLRALRDLARANPGIVHIGLYQTGSDDEPEALEAERTVLMNRLVLPDPVVNPFENLLFAGMSYSTDPEGFAWDAESNESEEEHFLQGEAEEFERHAGKLSRPVCGHVMHGGCAYGSRCRHYHPERQEFADTTQVVDTRSVTRTFTTPKLQVQRPNDRHRAMAALATLAALTCVVATVLTRR